MVVIARDKDEPYVAGDEGIGNRRDGPAFEIGVEDRKIEVGFPRRFQRLVDARSLGGDGIADLTSHVRKQHADQHVVSDDEELGLLGGLRFGCHRLPSAGTGTWSESDSALRLPSATTLCAL